MSFNMMYKKRKTTKDITEKHSIKYKHTHTAMAIHKYCTFWGIGSKFIQSHSYIFIQYVYASLRVLFRCRPSCLHFSKKHTFLKKSNRTNLYGIAKS